MYKKIENTDDTCPICGSYAAINIYKKQKLDSSLNELELHRLFFGRVQKVFDEMNLSIWISLGGTAWKSANDKEKIFLTFCKSFVEVSGEPTQSESDYWDIALMAEANVRAFLVDNNIQLIKQDDFQLSLIADGMFAGKEIRSMQAHYGISLCGQIFQTQTLEECERKYQKAIKITERLAVMGCSVQDNLPYFNAATYLAEQEQLPA